MNLASWTLPSTPTGNSEEQSESTDVIAGNCWSAPSFRSIGPDPARRVRSATRKSVSRRGYTLVEIVVVISMLTMIISLAGMTFHLLLRADKSVLQAFVTERTISRLAILFREDVHRADAGVIEAEAEQTPQRLSLESPGRDPVRYAVTEEGIVRLTLEHGSVVARDDFVLPECEVFLTAGDADAVALRTLVIERPAASLVGKRQDQAPRRQLKIEAYLHRPYQGQTAQPTQPSDPAESLESAENATEAGPTTESSKEEEQE